LSLAQYRGLREGRKAATGKKRRKKERKKSRQDGGATKYGEQRNACTGVREREPPASGCGRRQLDGRDGRAEFAGDEGVGGAEAGGELCGGQTAVVVEAAEMSFRGEIALLRVAFAAARDEVAEGIVL